MTVAEIAAQRRPLPWGSTVSAHAAALPASGLSIGACFAALAALGDLRAHLGAFIVLFGAAFVVYLAAVWLVARQPDVWSGRRLAWLLGFALMFRLLMLATAPTLSDDVYRYVWEGRVLAAGGSPYRYVPSAPELQALRDDVIWAH